MTENERETIYRNLILLDTDELVNHWLKHDDNEWMPIAFEVMEEILIERLGELPQQGYIPSKPTPPVQEKRKSTSLNELKVLIKDNDPVFYDPNKVIILIKWIFRVLNGIIFLYVVQFLFNNWYYFDALKEYELSSALWIDIGFSFVTLLVTIFVLFVEMRTLAYILKILREMEINSRKNV